MFSITFQSSPLWRISFVATRRAFKRHLLALGRNIAEAQNNAFSALEEQGENPDEWGLQVIGGEVL